jgi:orotate phosphoribosyltransferase-like protein
MRSNMKYGEETEMVCFRVPKSKKGEIKQLVKLRLNDYEKTALAKEFDVSRDKPEWKVNAEKKSNPTDYVLGVPAEKLGEKENDLVGISKLATAMNSNKKVDISKEYEFDYVKSIPGVGINDAIYVDKKGLACYDKDDLGVFYVKWEGKYIRFEDKAEFDRFAKEYLTLI